MRAVSSLFAVVVAFVALLAGRASAGPLIEAPPSMAAFAARVRAVDLADLGRALKRAGLTLPDDVRVTLVPDDDPRARPVPQWVVGLASGPRDIVIFPQRVPPYPYDSVESVFRHEVAHLALAARAGGAPLPRWFHEGVAMSIDRGWDTSGQLRLLLEMIRNPRTEQLGQLFASNTQPESALAYGLSAALVADLQQRHDPAVIGALAAQVAAGVPFARGFEIETGETPDSAASRAWAAYRRWTNWVPALTSGTATWALILVIAAGAYATVRRRRIRRRRAWDEEESVPPTAP